MRLIGIHVGAVLALAGCSAGAPLSESPPTHTAVDTSVLVADVAPLVDDVLTSYIALTNDIVRGGDPDAIAEVSTAEWTLEEQAGFATLEALGSDAPLMTISKFEVASVRGRHTLVDAMVSACIAGGAAPMGVSIHLVPRAGRLAIASITPWEDSTWCAVSPSL